jgi:hypothetical protein
MVRDVTTAAVRPERGICAPPHGVADVGAQPLGFDEELVEVADQGREGAVLVGGIGHRNFNPCNQYSLITA